MDSTPEKYGYWVFETLVKYNKEKEAAPPFLFVNSWNEWAEGSPLEPDAHTGRAYLEAHKQAVQKFKSLFG